MTGRPIQDIGDYGDKPWPGPSVPSGQHPRAADVQAHLEDDACDPEIMPAPLLAVMLVPVVGAVVLVVIAVAWIAGRLT